MRSWSARILFAVLALAGSSAPAGTRSASFVPWKILKAGDKPATAALNVYWVPASPDDFRRSELLRSDALTSYASQCVAMQVVRPEDGPMLAKLGAEKLPVVVLFDSEGKELARVAPERGRVRLDAVEDMVREQLDERGSEAEQLLDEARKKAEAGETSAAIALYSKVWDQRCTCPRQGRDAQRALKKLKR
jgi:hypothetical protein